MAGPLSGVPGQTIPLSTPYAPGQTPAQQVRNQEDQQPQENRVQPQSAPAAESQESQTGSYRNTDYDQGSLASLSDEDRAQSRRGSLVDIKV